MHPIRITARSKVAVSTPARLPDRFLTPALLALACATGWIAACGGGSDSPSPAPDSGSSACAACSTGSLSGTVDAGAPLAGASIVAIDSLGARKAGSLDATGAYSVDVTGMTAPFILEATGTAGGQVVQYHSIAVAGDVGKTPVNVTALTEIMSSIVLGGVPASLINAGTQDSSRINATAIGSAESTVQAVVLPVLQAAGAGSADLRTTAFTANGSGMDLALSEIGVSLVNGAYAVSTSLSPSTTTVVPTDASSSTALTVPSNAAALITAGSTAASSLKTVMSNLTAQFAGTQLPAASSLTPFLNADFLHDGQAGAAYVQNILLQDGAIGLPAFNLLGATFDQVQVTDVIDANNVRFRFRVTTALPYRPWSEGMFATFVNGQWLLRGDQHRFGVTANASAVLQETPSTLAEMTALGATLNAGATPPYYQLPVLDGAGNTVATAWLGYPGDTDFGTYGWIGDEVTPAGRLLRATYPLYYAHPDSRVSLGIQFSIHNNRIAANAAKVTVTGPGLPAQGIDYVPSSASAPRDTWVLAGNPVYVVTTFSNDACSHLVTASTPIPNCGLDWSQVGTAAQYSFVATDAGGTVLDTVRASLPIIPQPSESQLFTHRASLFAQVTPAASRKFSVANIYSASGPFALGSSVPVDWTLPTAPGSQLEGAWFYQQWPDATGTSEHSTTLFQPMYGTQPAPTTATYAVTAPSAIDWASTGVDVFDVYGNLYEHRVDGANHQ